MHQESHPEAGEDPSGPEPLEETADFPDSHGSISPAMPTRIGRYKIKRALATGGMGTRSISRSRSTRAAPWR